MGQYSGVPMSPTYSHDTVLENPYEASVTISSHFPELSGLVMYPGDVVRLTLQIPHGLKLYKQYYQKDKQRRLMVSLIDKDF